MKRLLLLASLCLPLFAAGCSVMAPRPDPTRFYLLTPAVSTGVRASAAASGVAIGLGPVQLPQYLDRLEVVTRVSENRLELSKTDRWSEPLDDNFRRVLASNLSTLLGTHRIVQYPWLPGTDLDYQIRVTVDRFEPDASNSTDLSAHWEISDGKTGKILVASDSSINRPVEPGDSGAAAALSADLGKLSEEIALAVGQLRPARGAEA